jgi:peptidoglycan/LPS O-acetylase OafA/YrhL
MVSSPPKPREHMRQLDGLRTIAVFGVIVSHSYFPTLNKSIPLGRFGVYLFFVLSGFLITGILFDCRRGLSRETTGGKTQGNATGQSGPRVEGASTGMVLRRFYIRRALRIAPIYYVALLVIVILNVGDARKTFGFNATYISNIYSIIHNSNDSITGHFWSLAVEEQFYLVWPLVILFTPRRWLLKVLTLSVLIAPAFRLVGGLLGLNYYGKLFLPVGCLDLLGAGALLAYMYEFPDEFKRSKAILKVCGVLGGTVAALYCIAGAIDAPPSGMETVVLPTALGMFFVFVVDGAARGFGGPLGAFLLSRPMSYLGKISYGLYLLHPFVSYALSKIDVIGAPEKRPVVHLVVVSLATVALASVSWRLVENPFNRRKSKYPYFPRPAGGSTAARVLVTPDSTR